MDKNLEMYKKELNQELQAFFKKIEKIPRDNPDLSSEWEYSKQTREKINKEIEKIYIKLQKKYNIKFYSTK